MLTIALFFVGLAYQIAFVLMENKDQAFLLNLIGLKSQAIDHMNHDQGSAAPTSMKGNALQTVQLLHLRMFT